MTLDKHHITLYVVAIVLSLVLAYGIADHFSAKKVSQDEQQLAVLQAESKAKDQQNIQFQQQIAQQVQQLTSTNQQLQTDKLNQQKQIQTLQSQLANQKQKDATLPPDQLVQHMAELVPGVLPAIVPNGAIDTYSFQQADVVKVEQALEEPPVLKQQIAADEVIIKNDTAIIANNASILDDEKKSHSSDVSAIQAKLDAANQDTKTWKDKAHHNVLKWFGIGYVAGFGSAVILKAFAPSFPLK